MPVAQAMVLDVVTEGKDRPKYIGICSSMLGLAFTVGPAISAGVTAATSFRITFFIAAGFSSCITVWAMLNVKETKKDILEARAGTQQAEKMVVESEGPPPPPLGLLVYGPGLSLYCVAWCFFVQSSVGPLAWEDLFGWGSTQLGIIQSVAGIIQVLADAFLARRAMAKFGAFNLCSAMALLTGVATILAFLVDVIVPHLLLVAFIFVGWGMIKTPMITIVGQYAPPEVRGAAVGTLLGSMSLGFATGPVVSGVFYDLDVVTSGDGFSYLPFIVGGSVATIGAINMFVVERLTRSEREEKEAAKLEVTSGLLVTNDGESGLIPRTGSSLMIGTSLNFDDDGSTGMPPRERSSFMESLEGMAVGSAV
jgi:predicted MFS family arabinose efflux permease